MAGAKRDRLLVEAMSLGVPQADAERLVDSIDSGDAACLIIAIPPGDVQPGEHVRVIESDVRQDPRPPWRLHVRETFDAGSSLLVAGRMQADGEAEWVMGYNAQRLIREAGR